SNRVIKSESCERLRTCWMTVRSQVSSSLTRSQASPPLSAAAPAMFLGACWCSTSTVAEDSYTFGRFPVTPTVAERPAARVSSASHLRRCQTARAHSRPETPYPACAFCIVLDSLGLRRITGGGPIPEAAKSGRDDPWPPRAHRHHPADADAPARLSYLTDCRVWQGFALSVYALSSGCSAGASSWVGSRSPNRITRPVLYPLRAALAPLAR